LALFGAKSDGRENGVEGKSAGNMDGKVLALTIDAI